MTLQSAWPAEGQDSLYLPTLSILSTTDGAGQTEASRLRLGLLGTVSHYLPGHPRPDKQLVSVTRRSPQVNRGPAPRMTSDFD